MRELALTINGQTINAPSGIPDPQRIGLNQILSITFTVLFLIAVLLTVSYLIWGAIDYITSTGDKNKIHAARGKIIYSIIGLIIVFLSFFFISIFGSILNIKLF